MNISSEEKLMYSVMRAIYESGIPINFKGSMVLKACLVESGFTEETRHTVDIDANWNSDVEPSAEQMQDSLQKAMNEVDEDLSVEIYRQHGPGRSAGFEIRSKKTEEPLFSMDIDVNRPMPPTKIYEIDGMQFRGVSPAQIIADKVYAISTDAVFRRPKDIVDLYYLSKVFRFEKEEMMHILTNSGRRLDGFRGFLQRTEDLKHSYGKFRFDGGVSKPSFEEVYSAVKSYIGDVLPREKKREICR